MTDRPLRIGVADLRRHLGERRELRRRVSLKGLAISTARVGEDAPVDVDLELESISGGVAVVGTVTASWQGECRRCLGPVEGVVAAEVREIFEAEPTEGETYPLPGDDVIDLEPLLRDAVLLSLPLAPLCDPDCAGPAPESFPTVLEGERPAEPDSAGGDPRWAALDELRFDDDIPDGT